MTYSTIIMYSVYKVDYRGAAAPKKDTQEEEKNIVTNWTILISYVRL